MKTENIEKYIKLIEYSMRHQEFLKGANRDIEKDGFTRAIEHNKTIFLNELQRQMRAQDKAEIQELKSEIKELKRQMEQNKVKAEVEIDKESLEQVKRALNEIFKN